MRKNVVTTSLSVFNSLKKLWVRIWKTLNLGVSNQKLTAHDDVDVLGNAHMTNYFTNRSNVSELQKALQAYSQTEKNLKEPNPDLFYNRATILEYLERYGEAIQNYNSAYVIDPSL